MILRLASSKAYLLTVFFFQGRTFTMLLLPTLVSACITTSLNNGIRLFDLSLSATRVRRENENNVRWIALILAAAYVLYVLPLRISIQSVRASLPPHQADAGHNTFKNHISPKPIASFAFTPNFHPSFLFPTPSHSRSGMPLARGASDPSANRSIHLLGVAGGEGGLSTDDCPAIAPLSASSFG